MLVDRVYLHLDNPVDIALADPHYDRRPGCPLTGVGRKDLKETALVTWLGMWG